MYKEYTRMYCDKNFEMVEISYEVKEQLEGKITKYKLGYNRCVSKCKICPASMSTKRDLATIEDFENKYVKRS